MHGFQVAGVLLLHLLAEALGLVFGVVELGKAIGDFTAKQILAEEKVAVAQEFFLGIVCDSVAKSCVAIFSPEGGVDIEDLARRQPEKVIKEGWSILKGNEYE